MAELLVRVKDKISEDFYKNCQCSKRGDVIFAARDGWGWGKDELSLPFYRILLIPNLPLEDAESLTAMEPADHHDPLLASKTRQKRHFRLDLDSFPEETLEYLNDDLRKRSALRLDWTREQVLALRQRKDAIVDPAIFGHDPKVF